MSCLFIQKLGSPKMTCSQGTDCAGFLGSLLSNKSLYNNKWLASFSRQINDHIYQRKEHLSKIVGLMSAYGGYLFQVLSWALFHRHCTVMQCLWRHLTLLKLHHPNPKTYVQNQGFPFPATLGLAYGIKKKTILSKKHCRFPIWKLCKSPSTKPVQGPGYGPKPPSLWWIVLLSSS